MTIFHNLSDDDKNKARIKITLKNGKEKFGVTMPVRKALDIYETICHAYDTNKNIRLSTEQSIITIPHSRIESIEIVNMGKWVD